VYLPDAAAKHLCNGQNSTKSGIKAKPPNLSFFPVSEALSPNMPSTKQARIRRETTAGRVSNALV
jgi:hypothetical protein